MDDEPVEVEVEVDGIKTTVQAHRTDDGWIVNVEGMEHHVGSKTLSKLKNLTNKLKK